MKIFNCVDELIGKTPLLELKGIQKEYGLKAKILAKLECFNPAGSAKDRVAKNMLDAAEKSGKINPQTLIIEPTSGNTGIGLAAVAAVRGYKTVIVMPDNMSKERINLIKAYGAKVVLSDGKLGMNGAILKAQEIAKEHPNSFIAGQFENPANPQIHYETTAPEIYEDTDGSLDIFVAGIGTGGTISGVGKYMKEKNRNIKIIGVEPAGSPYITKSQSGTHALQGIGAGFIPSTLNLDVVDEVICVEDNDALTLCRRFGALQGILIGISSAAALEGAIRIAKRPENEGKTIVVLFADSGERYLSTGIYE